MLKFNAHHFVAMSSTLGQAIIEFGRPNYIPHQDSLRMMAETCAQLQKDCEGLGLRLTVSHIKRFREDVLQYGVAFAAMRTYLVEIQQRVWDELELKLFLALEPTEQEFYAEPLRDWGFIIARFPNIRDDVEEARKCYALERYGASIFHLMRVTEAAALELGQLVDPHDHKPQFGSVLKKIDNLIQKTQWHDWPSDAQPHKALFADVLPRLYAVKDSWRDKVSHFDTHIIPTSATSNRERAFDIYNSTVSLLNLLAERLPRRTR
jgi:hypothetical protein